MSSINAQVQDGFREMCIRTWGAGHQLKRTAAQKAREQRGQTAAEYMGVLVLVGLIISALVALKVPQFIAQTINGLVSDIATGEDPNKRPPDPVK